MSTASKLPMALRQIRKLRARDAPDDPKTFSKKRPAATVLELRISSLVATEKYAMFASMYSTATKKSEAGALQLSVLVGF